MIIQSQVEAWLHIDQFEKFPNFSAFVTFRGLTLYREKLSECTHKNDEFNSLAEMTNSINYKDKV